MASSIKRRVALKGQSRSKFCGEPVKARSKTPCLRLSGHKGNHRPTTFRGGNERPVIAVTQLEEPGRVEIEVLPNVTVLAAVEAERLVAAPSKTVKRTTARTSGKPQLARPVVG